VAEQVLGQPVLLHAFQEGQQRPSQTTGHLGDREAVHRERDLDDAPLGFVRTSQQLCHEAPEPSRLGDLFAHLEDGLALERTIRARVHRNEAQDVRRRLQVAARDRQHRCGVALGQQGAEHGGDVLAHRDRLRHQGHDRHAQFGDDGGQDMAVIRRQRLGAPAEVLEPCSALSGAIAAEVEDAEADLFVGLSSRQRRQEERGVPIYLTFAGGTCTVARPIEAPVADHVPARSEDVGGADAAAPQARLALLLAEVDQHLGPPQLGGVRGDAVRKGAEQRFVSLVPARVLRQGWDDPVVQPGQLLDRARVQPPLELSRWDVTQLGEFQGEGPRAVGVA
jgi:hypothetical protein